MVRSGDCRGGIQRGYVYRGNGRKARIVEAKLENLERLANREKAMSIRELRANFESIVARTKVGKVFVASTKMLGKISGGIL